MNDIERNLLRLRSILSPEDLARIRAMQFVRDCEDGQNLDRLNEADVVIIGASRTKKTPTCVLLAFFRHVWAANVPIVPGVELPAQLEEIDSHRVILFKSLPQRLAEYRRQRPLGEGQDGPYADLLSVTEECRRVNAISAAHPEWRVIEVTRMSSEEAARHVFQHLTIKALLKDRLLTAA